MFLAIVNYITLGWRKICEPYHAKPEGGGALVHK
jgi:hypothetical protein